MSVAGFDIGGLDSTDLSNEGVKMGVRHPTTKRPLETEGGQKVTITLLGSDSDKYNDILNKIRRKRVEAVRDGELDEVELTEVVMKEADDIIAACTLGWEGIDWDGEPFPFSHENALKLYKRIRWLRNQADEFMQERSNFFPREADS